LQPQQKVPALPAGCPAGRRQLKNSNEIFRPGVYEFGARRGRAARKNIKKTRRTEAAKILGRALALTPEKLSRPPQMSCLILTRIFNQLLIQSSRLAPADAAQRNNKNFNY
jgi:hypothetical protein